MLRTILILTNRVPHPLHDGGALAMDAMIRGYQAAGWQVHLLAMNTSRHPVPDSKLQSLYRDIAGFTTVPLDNMLTKSGVLWNLAFSREPEHVARFKNPAFAAVLFGLLKKVKPDVVQLESPFLGSYLSIIRARAPQAVVIYRMHNVEGQIWSRLAAEAGGIRRWYLHLLARRMARYERQLWHDVDLILPITEADACTVRKEGVATPVQVVPFGISAVEEAEPSLQGPLKVYHLGAMDWLPNQEAVSWFLKNVWPGLYFIVPELTFHFAGRAMPDSFHEGLPSGAYCAGEVADAAAFIQNKHILVVPLHAGGGVRVKILEAMAQGKLVVSTDTGMQGIGAQDQLHYLRAENASDFIHLINWASKHREEATAIIQAAQDLVRAQYDEQAITGRIIRRLETMMTGM